MRAPRLSLGVAAGVAAGVLAAVLICAAALQAARQIAADAALRHELDGGAEALAQELIRCRRPEALGDPGCEAAWAEGRRRFFGEPPAEAR
jgi:conjugative transfer region protein TrbK